MNTGDYVIVKENVEIPPFEANWLSHDKRYQLRSVEGEKVSLVSIGEEFHIPMIGLTDRLYFPKELFNKS